MGEEGREKEERGKEGGGERRWRWGGGRGGGGRGERVRRGSAGKGGWRVVEERELIAGGLLEERARRGAGGVAGRGRVSGTAARRRGRAELMWEGIGRVLVSAVR